MGPKISLRLDHAQVTARARRLLRHLEEEDLLQRQIKMKASRAFLAVSELIVMSAPRLQKLNKYAQELKAIEARLFELSRRGI